MRRRSAEVQKARELFGSDGAFLDGLDPESTIAALEPLVTEDRRGRLWGVIVRRLDSVTVVMDAPHDPHNGGAVVRSCDAFGVQRLHVVERYEPFLVSKTVAKGSEKWVDVHLYDRGGEAADALAERGHEFIATAADGELEPHDLRGIARPVLVIGNERQGIADDLRRLCKRAVRVPMRGFADSLNLSVSTAILLAGAVAGREGDLPELERRRLYARGLYLTVPRAADVLVASAHLAAR